MAAPAMGIFVGGQGRRMGGVAKGLLRRDGQTLLDRLLDVCQHAAPSEAPPRLYLVGDAAAYADAHPLALADDPRGLGPLGGLRALLLEARRQGVDALALAVDLPYVTPELIGRLCLERPEAALLAPRQDGWWQPLFARYRPAAALPIVDVLLGLGRTSLQGVFHGVAAAEGAASVAELVLTSAEHRALRDWDRPSDMLGPDVEPEP